MLTVDDIEGGVRIVFAKAGIADLAAFLSQVRCHIAHAAYVARDGMPSCPFYVRGLGAQASEEGGFPVLSLRTNEPDALESLRARGRELFVTHEDASAPTD